MRDEFFSLGGVGPAPDAMPPGAALRFEPQRASEEGYLLSGQAFRQAGPVGSTTITIEPGEQYVVDLATKRAWEAARAGGLPLALLETYSDPESLTAWPGCILTRCDIREAPGTERGLYTYALTLTGGP